MKRETTIGQVLDRLLICTGCATALTENHVLMTCWRDDENKTETRFCAECAQWICWIAPSVQPRPAARPDAEQEETFFSNHALLSGLGG